MTQNLILPGNPRYQPRQLQTDFGYDNLYVPLGRLELATLRTLGDLGVIPEQDLQLLTKEIEQAVLGIQTTEVDHIERTVTRHDVRAWIRLAQEHLPQRLRAWVHIPLTSYDALDTARSLQFASAHYEVVRPNAMRIILLLAQQVERFADQIQIGRTHGQHALPITVGFWLATILNRILENLKLMDQFAAGLVGKVSGAVGAYNAQEGLGITELAGERSFEERVLEKLGLKAGNISTQIVQPEPLAYYLFSCLMLSGALGQFGRDCRHLMRTEIAEVREYFEAGQVGSSAMPHKRNPINFENIEGMWHRNKWEFGKVLEVMISEHQRDLVGSSILRDLPILVVNLTQQMNTLLRTGEDGSTFLERIEIDPEACERNFALSSKVILAEPLYIALQMAGYEGDAHQLVNERAMSLSQQEDISLIVAMERIGEEDVTVRQALEAIPQDIRTLLASPERYIGKAGEKAREIAAIAHTFLASQDSQGG